MNAPLRHADLSDILASDILADPFEIYGMTDEAHAILHDYDGELKAFVNDCTSECSACARRWFTGFGCMNAELDDFGRFTCEPCERRLESLRAGSIYDERRA